MSGSGSLISTNSPFLIWSTSLGGSGEKDGNGSRGCDVWLSIERLGTTGAIGASILDDRSGAANTVFSSKETSASDGAAGILPVIDVVYLAGERH